MNNRLVCGALTWLLVCSAGAQEAPAAASEEVGAAAPASEPAAAPASEPVPPTPTSEPPAAAPGYVVESAPRVDIVRVPLPPHRQLGGRHEPVPAAARLPDYAAPRTRPRKARVISDGRVALGLGGTLAFSRDPGFDYAFGGNLQRGVDAFAACDVLRPAANLAIALGASVRNFAGESRDHALDLRMLNATLDLSARYDVLPVLPVFVRAALGFARARLDFDDGDDTRHARDAAVIGQFGAGVVLQTAPGWFETYRGRLAKLSVGLTVEGGYTVGPALAPHIASATAVGVPQRYAQPGQLDTRAPYLRLLATARF